MRRVVIGVFVVALVCVAAAAWGQSAEEWGKKGDEHLLYAGICLMWNGDDNECKECAENAITSYAKAINLKPNYSEVYPYRSDVYQLIDYSG